MRIPLLAGLILTLFIGCRHNTENSGPDAPADNHLEIVDDVGRTLILPEQPQRVIPLAPNLTELIYAAGAGAQVAAVSIADDYPPDIQALPRFSSYPMDFEALVSHQPDILLATTAINNPKDAAQFTSLNLPVLYYSFSTWADIPRVIREIGRLTGREAVANQKADSLSAAILSIKQKTSILTPQRTLFLIGSDQLYAFGRDNYIHEAIAFAGGKSLTADLEAVSPILSEEFVISAEPEVIIGTFRDAAQLLENHPAFKDVPAVVNNRVCIVDGSLVLRPGPRLLAGIEDMAKCLHPDLFSHVALAGEDLLTSQMVD